MWFSRKLNFINKTGKFILRNEQNINFNDSNFLKYLSTLKLIKYFDISNTDIFNIEGLPYLPKINTFIANNSQLNSLKNFLILKNCRNFSIINTPLMKINNIELIFYILFGKNLLSFNGKQISKKIYKLSLTYPSYTKDLINQGWIPIYPCPNNEELKVICKEFNVEISETYTPNLINIFENNSNTFEELLINLRKKHNEMIIKSLAIFGIYEEKNNFFN